MTLSYTILSALIFTFSATSADAETGVPKRSKRIQTMEKAGLTGETSAMDELDQDMLYMRAGNLSQEELQKKYPQISAAKLGKLKSAVQEK